MMTLVNVHFKIDEDTYFGLQEYMARNHFPDYISMIKQLVSTNQKRRSKLDTPPDSADIE